MQEHKKVGASRKRVLVTGATGFLGRHVLNALAGRSDVDVIAACRSPERIDSDFRGEVRPGDLLDPAYRMAVVQGIDVVCHAGTWGSFWGHEALERTHFFAPTLDLLERAIDAGVGRFLLASTVALGAAPTNGEAVGDFSPPQHTGFWPHLDRLVDLDRYMRENAGRGMQMVCMRLGHFVGKGNERGMVPALIPRLRTRLVPWLGGGRKRLALVADTDLGEAFALASVAPGLADYESFNVCGSEFPTAREVFEFLANETRSPKPWYSVPYGAGYAFAWLMEALHPILPGSSPFLTRSIVHVSEDWYCPTDYATQKLGYVPRKDWREAVREALAELQDKGYPWPLLAQAT